MGIKCIILYMYNDQYDKEILNLVRSSKFGYYTTIRRNKKYEYLKQYIYENTQFFDKYNFNANIATRIFYIIKKQQDIYRCCIDNKPYLFNLSLVFNTDIDLNHLHCCHKCAMKDDILMQHKIETVRKKYGVDYYYQSQEFKNKNRQTCLKKYGTEFYTQSEHYKKQVENYNISNETKEKLSIASKKFWNSLNEEQKQYEILRRYDANIYNHNGQYHSTTPEFKNIWKDKQRLKTIKQKEYETKKKNNSFNTSKSEEKTYVLLCEKFGQENVLRQYKSDKYPFNCDFYIRTTDMYIECNYSWTHGGHPFDENNNDDLKIVELWKSKNTAYYNNAIKTWTERDVKKRNTAKENNLNYIEFWCINDCNFFVVNR